MNLIGLLFCFLPTVALAQTINYSPNRKIEKTVAKTYYNTEYIYLENTSDQPVDLNFELVDNTLLSEWSATICTSSQCFTFIPKAGSLGSLQPSAQAYFSFNFAANNTLGSGQVRYLMYNKDGLQDTLTFVYTVNEDGKQKAGPWATINYVSGALTVILENPHLETNLYLADLQGHVLADQPLEHITSIPLYDFPKGVYFVHIRDENQRVIQRKILHF